RRQLRGHHGIHVPRDDPGAGVLPHDGEAHRRRTLRSGEGLIAMSNDSLTPEDQSAARPGGISPRVRALVAELSLDEKLAQIVGFWEGEEGDSVAPLQGELASTGKLDDAMKHGLGQLTRVYGTNPVDPDERAAYLWQRQRSLV